MKLNKTEREVLRWRVKFVIPQMSKFKIWLVFNQMVFDEELSIISKIDCTIEGQSRTKCTL
jgi:hypothetical protein